MRPAAIA